MTTQIDRIEAGIASVNRKLNNWGILIMSTLQELQAGLDALSVKVDADAAQSAQAVTLLQALTATIADLKSQIGAGTPVTQAQLDALTAQVTSITGKLQASDDLLAGGLTAATPV